MLFDPSGKTAAAFKKAGVELLAVSTDTEDGLKFTVEKADTYYVCGCKKTGKAPFCDGTHKKG